MKLTKQMLREMIEEIVSEADDETFHVGKLENPLSDVEDEEPIDVGGSEWNKGLSDGKRTTARLLKKREKQTAKGLLKYIDIATEHRSASYKAGYKMAFELHFSAVLGTPPSKGQLPYANAPRAPRPGFFGFRYENKLKEAITGTSLHDLVAGGSLYDIMKKSGMDRLLNAAYVSGQRNEPIEELDDGDPWFQGKFPLLQKQWKKGRQWASEQYPDFAG